jgi:hypothetical protein
VRNQELYRRQIEFSWSINHNILLWTNGENAARKKKVQESDEVEEEGIIRAKSRGRLRNVN